MKYMSLMMLCVLGMVAGCEERPKPPPKTDAEIQEIQNRTVKDAYPVVLKLNCLDGVQYYFADYGHSGILAPVVDKTTLQFKPCGLP